jgi:pimeloyl-ACP methyl ester carboxylesterase
VTSEVRNESKPAWFDRALAVPSEQGDVEVDGVRIRFETWGEVGLPGLVLIHGSNAHREWWRFVAPFLADQFRVAALDLSGNGDSGWRERYTGAHFAAEVWGVCQAARLGPRPTIIGHSFGGFVALEAAYRHGHESSGVILADFTVRPPEAYTEWGRRAEREGVQPRRGTRVYETFEAALARFRLMPEQPCPRWMLDHIGAQSLRQVDGGWTWKFDPALFDHLEMGMAQRDKFATLACRSAVILGEHSTDGGALAAPYMREITRGITPIFMVPGTYHHLMFDEPIAFAMAIKGIALSWQREERADELAAALHAIAPVRPE